MGTTNHTTNYNLGLFIGTDKPTWLGDWNTAMNTIDGSIKTVADQVSGAVTDSGSALSKANQALADVDTLDSIIETNQADITALFEKNTSQDTAISNAQTTANNANSNASAAQTTANNATSAASTASSTANTANSRADSAYNLASTANTGQINANDKLDTMVWTDFSRITMNTSVCANVDTTRQLSVSQNVGIDLLCLTGVCKFGTITGSTQKIGTLPSNIVRPSATQNIPIICLRRGSGDNVMLALSGSIDTNGNVYITAGAEESSNVLYFQFTYVTKGWY